MPQTKIIILRKTQYKENSLIVSGITPEFGKLDFIINSAKKTKFPIVDMFRELDISFKHDDGRFQKIYKTELVNNYDSIVQSYEVFEKYCELSKFILKHSFPMHESKQLYFALKTSLDIYVDSLNNDYEFTSILSESLIYFSFLYDGGFLPVSSEHNELWFAQLADFINKENIDSIKKIDCDYWSNFNPWLKELVKTSML